MMMSMAPEAATPAQGAELICSEAGAASRVGSRGTRCHVAPKACWEPPSFYVSPGGARSEAGSQPGANDTCLGAAGTG